MKKIFLLVAGAALFTACNNETKSSAAAGDTTAVKSSAPLPYTASYSSSFKMGNPEYSALILQGSWKDWENICIENAFEQKIQLQKETPPGSGGVRPELNRDQLQRWPP